MQDPMQDPEKLPPIPSPTGRVRNRIKKPPRARKTSRFECPHCHFRFGLNRADYWKHFFLVRRPVLKCPACRKKSIRQLPRWTYIASWCAMILGTLPVVIIEVGQAWNATLSDAGMVVFSVFELVLSLSIYTVFIRILNLHFGVLARSEEDNP